MEDSNYKTLNEKWGRPLYKYKLAKYLGISWSTLYKEINTPFYLDELKKAGYRNKCKILKPPFIKIILQKYFLEEEINYLDKNKKIQS